MNTTITSLIFQAVFFQFPQVKEAVVTPYGDSFPKEKELVKAQLVVELMDRYHYPPQAIHVNYLVPVYNKAEYAEADIFVVNKENKPFMVFLVETPQKYQANFEQVLDQLYELAPVLNKEKTLSFLCYYTRWYEEGNLRRRESVLDFKKYPTKVLWEQSHRPLLPSIPFYL